MGRWALNVWGQTADVLARLAVVPAAVGIYGLIASSVVERTREIGIRLALGAPSLDANRSIVAPGMALMLAGIAIGSKVTQN